MEQMLDFIYQMTFKLFCYCVFLREIVNLLPNTCLCKVIMDVTKSLNIALLPRGSYMSARLQVEEK